MTIVRMTTVTLLQPLTYKGLLRVPGAVIDVRVDQAIRLEKRGLAQGTGDVYIIGEAPEAIEVVSSAPDASDEEDDDDEDDRDASE